MSSPQQNNMKHTENLVKNIVQEQLNRVSIEVEKGEIEVCSGQTVREKLPFLYDRRFDKAR